MSGRPPLTRTSSRAKTATPVPSAPAISRTTRARTATSKAATTETTITSAKQTKKPLISKENTSDALVAHTKGKPKTAPVRKTGRQAKGTSESEREPIMAYLRIRPRIGEEPSSAPYLMPLSDTTVNMTDPQDPQNNRLKYRFSSVPPSSIYTFSHIFPPDTTQYDFFKKTTLPLVQDVLTGQNALLFTYGVTNSGKTYTVQGGTNSGAAGILPRSLDVIFNSIEGLHGDGRFRPVRLHGIELADDSDFSAPPAMPDPALTDVLGPLDSEPDFEVDSTVVTVDRNYEYTIWISYAEVYNEKVYDLLASVKDGSAVHGEATSGIPRPAGVKSLLLTRQALPLRTSPPTDSDDTESSGKYIAGLRQFRVHTASQAKALVKLGQLHRRVFGTLANRESSRSHGMVIIKIVRGHRGERNDPTSLQISRLTLVDLAGSERTKHTHTTGDRLREAGNINKSLMVLGQCMEVMRSNQRKLAMSLSNDTHKDNRLDTRDLKKGFTVVPFRHSKLTEALMDYFAGDGRTVIIVNVNPYDTGYDENSHVMKFAALAKDVYITPAPAPVHRIPVVGPGNTTGKKIKQLGPLTLKDPEIAPRPFTRKVTISMGNQNVGKKPVEAVLEVCEEDEPTEEADKEQEDEDSFNPLVEALFDEIEHLRFQLFESEMRCALVEAETREEVMREMEERMSAMEAMYSRRLMSELERHEQKTDAKIDMLHQAGLFGSPQKASRLPVDVGIDTSMADEDEEAGVETSLVSYGEEEGSYEYEHEHERSMSISPLAKKVTRSPRKSNIPPQPIVEKRTFVSDPPMVLSDTEEAQFTDWGSEDEINNIIVSGDTRNKVNVNDENAVEEEEDDSEDEDEEYNEKEEESDEYEPLTGPRKMMQAGSSTVNDPSPYPSSSQATTQPALSKNSRVSKLARDFDELYIDGCGPDSPTIITSNKNVAKKASSQQNDEEDELMMPPPKKKKRIINKKPIITEEEFDKLVYKSEKLVTKLQGVGTINRFGR